MGRVSWLLIVLALDACATARPNAPEPSPPSHRRIEPPTLDDDGDGVANDADRCPEEPEDGDGFRDEDGCPEADNDGDGLRDEDDRCAEAAEDRDGFEDADGCPDDDNDGDGVPDDRDRGADGTDCRNEAEVFNGSQDEDGCPDTYRHPPHPAFDLDLDPLFHDGHALHEGEAAREALDAVASLLRRRSDIELLAVEGHVAPGPIRGARARSQMLAEAAVQQLVARGVEPGRLAAVGFGVSCPLVLRPTRQTWRFNNRIAWTVVRLSSVGRTRAWVGCARGRRLVPATIGSPVGARP